LGSSHRWRRQRGSTTPRGCAKRKTADLRGGRVSVVCGTQRGGSLHQRAGTVVLATRTGWPDSPTSVAIRPLLLTRALDAHGVPDNEHGSACSSSWTRLYVAPSLVSSSGGPDPGSRRSRYGRTGAVTAYRRPSAPVRRCESGLLQPTREPAIGFRATSPGYARTLVRDRPVRPCS
jgi:hypothetical protein